MNEKLMRSDGRPKPWYDHSGITPRLTACLFQVGSRLDDLVDAIPFGRKEAIAALNSAAAELRAALETARKDVAELAASAPDQFPNLSVEVAMDSVELYLGSIEELAADCMEGSATSDEELLCDVGQTALEMITRDHLHAVWQYLQPSPLASAPADVEPVAISAEVKALAAKLYAERPGDVVYISDFFDDENVTREIAAAYNLDSSLDSAGFVDFAMCLRGELPALRAEITRPVYVAVLGIVASLFKRGGALLPPADRKGVYPASVVDEVSSWGDTAPFPAVH